MALSFVSSTRFSKMQYGIWHSGSFTQRVSVRCCEIANEAPRPKSKLQVGSPIIIVEAPKVIKTAASMPCLRANSGLVKPGDVGRIVSRKPKDLWAVRLSIGTYLLDGKYFKALELDEGDSD
ncbi:DUF3148 family protein [Arabidopsis thaliana]|uniref:Protein CHLORORESPIRATORY REDUCTION 42, chloroplastic n=1 Tax=Arabidopsis thaliana TaxID=3702 RepID=CHR42_ARATH|nr:DUF3148 family protein [Arabidopsis thaliana]F4K6X0.2 RecName: Full=Protein CHLORORESPIRATORY REDUCTION 42, chloroplastic; Flags: Precursor [Arabidopsis thaliana]AED92908.2 DUF3148 family protein [Arabidopsis thaliana]|eukprot:NP_568406.2 DUF3148 family protein [Arabidopsis thaliana]